METALHFLLTCIVTVARHGFAQQQDFCSTRTYGHKTQFGDFPMQAKYLQQGIREWEVEVDTFDCEEGGLPAGLQVKVCEYDRPPRVFVASFSKAHVHRTGNLLKPARVDARVYCKNATYVMPFFTPQIYVYPSKSM